MFARRPSKAHLWDYFILTARVLLAFTFIGYGYSKLSGGQFGLTPAQAALPVSQLKLFKLAWYMFDHEPFRSFVGVSQILAGLLLLWNRTALLGALLLLPIAANVLIIDITYLKMPGFYWRLSYYIGLIFSIFWHYRARMIVVFYTLTQGLTTRFTYPWWAYGLLPVAAIGTEIAGMLPNVFFQLVTNPRKTWHGLVYLWDVVMKHLAS
ncbi:DoxX family membrane protein [Hymenobacter sp. BT188]|uniref:DoxX family membrane protein n=1 Tax=Hymenobacter sp. BT188 TaxID=2763504 RepID=UPI001650E853|nr:DoxX family membrane protein [Hymenobacter sp. BT188]MBC6609164.1 DoxX family membrane protein [Hymenobacter sp. BT188]